jgi:hypothetical protein
LQPYNIAQFSEYSELDTKLVHYFLSREVKL